MSNLDDALNFFKAATISVDEWCQKVDARKAYDYKNTNIYKGMKALEAAADEVAPPPPSSFTVTQTLQEGQELTSPIIWQATPSEVSDPVQFYIDGQLKWTEHLGPYFFNGDGNTLDPSALSVGNHEFKVVAHSAGQTAENKITANVKAAAPPPAASGKPLFYVLTDSSTDSTMQTNPQWVKDHWLRAATFLQWSFYVAQSHRYIDAEAIYNPNNPNHRSAPTPDFTQVLKDSVTGAPLFISWIEASDNGIYPQYAADIGNQKWRDTIMARVKAVVDQGNKGVFFDDVNLAFHFVDSSNGAKGRSPAGYTIDQYRSAWATFMEQVRTAFPVIEITHNSRWFDSPNHDGQDPNVIRQIKASDWVNMERGIVDGGLTGGTGDWSMNRLFKFVDTIHSCDRSTIWMSYATTAADAEMNLAAYWMTRAAKDMCQDKLRLPSNWLPLHDVDLGDPAAARTYDSTTGLYRRVFSRGVALLLEPGRTAVTSDGVTLQARTGRVLVK